MDKGHTAPCPLINSVFRNIDADPPAESRRSEDIAVQTKILNRNLTAQKVHEGIETDSIFGDGVDGNIYL